MAFKLLCAEGHIELIQYFIFEINIELTDDINQYLKNTETRKNIKNMFTMRELTSELVNSNNENSKKFKL
jgi:hypothetical protein